MEWRSRCLLLIMAAGSWVGSAGAESSAAPVPRTTGAITAVPLFLDPRSFEEAAAPAGDLVRLTRFELEGLVREFDARRRTELEAAAEALRADAARPPQPWVIESVRGEVHAEDGRVSADLVLDVRVLETGEALVPLFDEPVSIAAVEIPEGSGRLITGLRAEAEGTVDVPRPVPSLATTGPALRTVRLRLVHPVASEGARRTMSLPLPHAAVQRLRMTLPGPASGISVKPSAPTRVTREEGEPATIETDLSLADVLEVTWMAHGAQPAATAPTVPAAEAAASREPRLSAVVHTLYMIKDRAIRMVSAIEIKNSQGSAGSVDLTVPLGMSIRSLTGADVQGYRPSVDQDRLRLSLGLRQPLRGRTSLVLEGEMALPDPGDAPESLLTLPAVEVPGAIRLQGTAGVSAFAPVGVEAVPAESRDVVEIPVSEVDDSIRKQAASPVLKAFRFKKGSPRIALTLKRFDAVVGLDTVINELTAVTVITPGSKRQGDQTDPGRLNTINRMVLKVTNARGRYLKVTLPKTAKVLACFVDLIPQPPSIQAADPGGTHQDFLVALKRSEISGESMIPYPIEFTYKLDVDHELSHWGALKIRMPQFDAPITSSTWNVYFPDGRRICDVRGTFRWLSQERDLVLVQVARDVFESLLLWSTRLLMLTIVLTIFFFVGHRMRASKSRVQVSTGWMIQLTIVFVIVGVLAAIAVPNFKRARERANTRACFANQKTIAGAVEMYNLDNNTILKGYDRETLQLLVSNGYLQSMPSDPGFGELNTYQPVDTGNGITCANHGAIHQH